MQKVNKNRRSFRHMGWSNRLFYAFSTVFWVIAIFIVIYPLYFIVIASLSDPNAVYLGKVIWKPADVSLIGYKYIFKYKELWRGYANSLLYTAACILIANCITLLAGYAMSRKTFPGKELYNYYFIITMFFGGGLIPTYLFLKSIGLYNNIWIMILPGCFGIWNMMITRTYIQTSIPDDLYEASVLDGASHFQYFCKVVLPLSKTIIAVLAVYYGLGKWNDYFNGVVYIRDRELLPLQTILREVLAQLQSKFSTDIMEMMYEDLKTDLGEVTRVANVAKYCMMIVSTVPVVILYLFVQKYFEKGVMIGSLKG